MIAIDEENCQPIQEGIKISRTQKNLLRRLPPGVAIFAIFLFSAFLGVILQLSSEMLRPNIALVMYVAGKASRDYPAAIPAAENEVAVAESKKTTPIQRPQFVSEELNSKWLSLGLVSIPSDVEAVSTQVKAIGMTWGGEMAKQFIHTNLEVKYGTSKLEVVYLNRTTPPTYAELILQTIQSVDNVTLSNEYKWVIWCHYQMYINTEILRKMLLAMDPSFPVVASVEHTGTGGRLKVPPIIAMSFPAISVLSNRLDLVFWSPDGNTIEIQPQRLSLMGVKYIDLQDTNKKIEPPAKKLLLEVTDKMLIEQLTSINGLSESLTIGPIEDANLMFKLGYYLYEEMYIELEKKLDDIVKYHNEMQNKVPARLSGYEVWPNGINPPFKPHSGEGNIPWDNYNYDSNIETSSILQEPSRKVKRVEKIAIQKMLANTKETCVMHLAEGSNASSLQVKEIKKHFSPGYGYEYRVIMTNHPVTPSDDDTVEHTYLIRTAIPLGDPIQEMIQEINNNPHLNIILPLSSVTEKFKQFMKSYEEVCLKQQLPLGISVSLHIITVQMFSVSELKRLVYHYITDYHNANITVQETEQAADLQQAAFLTASAMDDNPLLWLTDASFQFSAEFIQQCVLFPSKQKTFFPIPRNSEGTSWVLDSYTNICGYANDITVANRYVETLEDVKNDVSYDIFDWFVKHQSTELIRSPAPELMQINSSPVNQQEDNKLLTI